MKKVKNSLLLLILTFSSALAQENDFQSWYLVTINKKIIKKTSFSIKSGLRLRENSSLYSRHFFDSRIRRNLNKKYSLALGIRYSHKKSYDSNYFNVYRFYSDFRYKNKFTKRLRYSIRNRFQMQGIRYNYDMLLRQKLTLSYNIKKTKLTPNISSEYFLPFDEGINKLRHTFSFSHPLNKNIDFELAYRIQQEFYVNNPQTLFIFEGRLSYDL